ncbi:hypothetical protein IH979_02560 [Patescibacteria group bacterium]|nr:hypothetical protein [Patescibacteria group bacterium]
MRTNRAKIYALVKQSNLTRQEQLELLAFCYFTGDEHLKSLVDLFRQDSDTIRMFYQNVKAKHEAAQKQDMVGFQKMLEQEKEILGRLGEEK